MAEWRPNKLSSSDTCCNCVLQRKISGGKVFKTEIWQKTATAPEFRNDITKS